MHTCSGIGDNSETTEYPNSLCRNLHKFRYDTPASEKSILELRLMKPSAIGIGLLVYLAMNLIVGVLAFVLFPRVLESQAFWVERFVFYFFFSSLVIVFLTCFVTARMHPPTWRGNVTVALLVCFAFTLLALRMAEFRDWVEKGLPAPVILIGLLAGWLGGLKTGKS